MRISKIPALIFAVLLCSRGALAAIAIESGFPVNNYVGGGPNNTITKAITTAGASLIVAAIASSGNGNEFQTTMSGAGLTWTIVAGASVNKNSGSQGSEWWYAVSAGALTAQTVTCTRGGTNGFINSVLTVYSITGYKASPIGASAGTTTALQVTVNAQASGSLVLVQIYNHTNQAVLTADAANSPWDLHNEDVGNATAWAVGHNLTASSGNVTVGSSNTVGTDNTYGSAVEILAAASSSGPPMRSLMGTGT